MKTKLIPTFLSCAAVLLAGCTQESAKVPAAAEPAFVAKVGDITISPDELASALSKRVRAVGAADARLRDSVLEELVREKVLLTRARAAGVDRDQELVRRWEKMVVAKYEADHKLDAEKQPAPAAAEVEQYYRTHAAEFQRPERLRLALIQIKGPVKATDEKRAELRARAEKVLALARAEGANFTELARLHSEDRATRYSGGDGGWMERGQTPPTWPKELAEAAFALETPEVVAPLVEAGGSFYVLKLLECQAAGVRPLAEVRDRIAHQLKQQKTADSEQRFYADQRAGVKVEVNTAAVQAVPLPAPALAKIPGEPPALPAN